MYDSLKFSLAATLFFWLSVMVWKLGFEYSDWAILGLAPLSIATFLGAWELAIRPWRVTLRTALRDSSWLTGVLPGRLRAGALAIGFTVLALWLVIWQATDATSMRISLMLLCAFFGSVVFFPVERVLLSHFHQPFARRFAVFVATVLVATVFMCIFAYDFWAWQEHSGELKEMSFAEAVAIGWEKAPPRSGWLSRLVAVHFVFNMVLVWGVLLTQSTYLTVLFVLVQATFAFALARTGIVVAQLFYKASLGRAEK